MSSITRLSPTGPVTFKRRALEPATESYVTSDDVILFGVRSSETPTVTFRARVQKPDGTIAIFEHTQIIESESDTTVRFRLLDGFLLGAAISTSSTTLLSGECYVWAHMISAGGTDETVARALIGGYLIAGMAIGWPDTPILAPGTGPGFAGTIPAANPGAGAEMSFNNTTDRRVRLIAFRAEFTTDATVSNRRPGMQLRSATGVAYRVPTSTVQTASLTRGYSSCASGAGQAAIGTEILLPFPVDVLLPAGFFLETSTDNLQEGDVWNEGFVFAEMWVLPTIT